MAHEEDRRWRDADRRDQENRRDGDNRNSQNYPRHDRADARFGEYRDAGRDDSPGSGDHSWDRHMDRDNSRSGGMSGQGGRSDGNWNDRDRWGERSCSNWEQTSWNDLGRNGGRESRADGDYSRSSSPRGDHRDHGRSGQDYRQDYRQDRDYGGSMRSGGERDGSGSQNGRSGMRSSANSMHRGYGYAGSNDWGPGSRDEGRGFWDKATDEISSWFGDEDAERRRETDRRHSGLGPRNYTRSDSRITEDVCDRLTEHPMVDASDIEVEVSAREVTLTGTVKTRDERRRAEDIVEAVSGVAHVQNNLRVKQQGESGTKSTLDSLASATSGAFGERGGSTMSSRSTEAAAGSAESASGNASDTPAKTTTGASPGVMRADPSSSPTKGL